MREISYFYRFNRLSKNLIWKRLIDTLIHAFHRVYGGNIKYLNYIIQKLYVQVQKDNIEV